ncbi:MAG: hypothetical protein CVU97_04450 [Firmicutes bacterium HGW-Firmicutes-21]|nr:MAG: hypothetical protein CVU97_04450 [Firmicutes bacterium HGW-Firmicutes-21]
MKLDKLSVAAIICATVTVVLNTVAYFFLPESIITQPSLSGIGRHTSTLLYLIGAAGLVLLPAGITVFTDGKNKWAAPTVVLASVNAVFIAYNLLK